MMQLYTINATPERYDVSEEENARRHAGYARYVSEALCQVLVLMALPYKRYKGIGKVYQRRVIL